MPPPVESELAHEADEKVPIPVAGVSSLQALRS